MVLGITQARMGSTRLPGKMAVEVAGMTMLELHLSRISQSKRVDEWILATTESPQDDVLCEMAYGMNMRFYRGEEHDVLDRYYKAMMSSDDVSQVVRVTADCPLLDPRVIDEVVMAGDGVDYASNTLQPTFPHGQDVESISYRALRWAWERAELPSDREHVTPMIRRNCQHSGESLFSSKNVLSKKDRSQQRMTVDHPEDLTIIESLVDALGTGDTWENYSRHLEENPDLASANAMHTRGEGYRISLERDKDLTR